MRFFLLCIVLFANQYLLAAELTQILNQPANTDMTEWVAVTTALAQADIRTQLAARRAIAQNEMQSAGRWDNPRIEYSRETLNAVGGDSEETSYLISQTLNLTGVHGLERAAAQLKFNADEARLELLEREIAAEIRQLFYTALVAQMRVAHTEAWHQRLKDLTRAVTARTKAGDASRYDQLRLQRELVLAENNLLQARAEVIASRDHLFTLINSPARSLHGQVLPLVNPQNSAEHIASKAISTPSKNSSQKFPHSFPRDFSQDFSQDSSQHFSKDSVQNISHFSHTSSRGISHNSSHQLSQNTATEISNFHPSIRALKSEAESAAKASRADKRKVWPEVTVGFGQREVIEGGERADGNIVSLGVEIPLFDRRTNEASAANHRVHLLQAELAVAQQQMLAEIRATYGQWRIQTEAVVSLTRELESDQLRNIAEAAYSAGEMTVTELLDAHRTELALRDEILNRSFAARQAYIHWQTLIGE